MQVIKLDAHQLQRLAPQPPLVLALGFFDGVHQGHQRVIQTARRIAVQRGLPLAVMTFNRHASQLFQSHTKFRYLNTVTQKIQHMADLQVQRLYITDFNNQFAKLSPVAFIKDYLVTLNAQVVVAGFDYTFGQGGTHGMRELAQLGTPYFETVTVDRLANQQLKVSSTRIRGLIAQGQLASANDLLGYPYETQATLKPLTRAIILANTRQQVPAAGDYRCWLVGANYRQSVVIRVANTLQIISPYQLPPLADDLTVNIQWQNRVAQVDSTTTVHQQRSQL
ncbi:FAD synthetase family protein [Lactiplantibacillus paraplantarum]|uniref:FAD synthase n=1 Tax=Lactiplantibacillus paraplantarum TaxID=60520 RepID=A0AAD0TNB4_9LACO|nr:FAD synthetase family protein [Lactiplantibacillus paraplantarum]AVW09710.1 FAD synthetase [Lactiplantibacillus paraplantarum]AYJ37923.1 FAD synthetase [Lactiplantibacillus paraplantarum]ERL45595.1 riboflavin kinase/FMN adenylyltransferase [Lactiplantibacillus paraplantarum]KRL49425.1 ribC1 protein [Lactiplantibacillus paraplantarum DSM 10667]MCU4682879.1 FAD synthetase family protein [Lactiplantibacillus paraplantarum]